MEPLLSFSSFNLHPSINKSVVLAGYKDPTPIQLKAIPHVSEGKDVLGLAETGTGKTAAFALPILNSLLQGPRNRARALIVVPTRELAEQVNKAFRSLSKGTRLRSTAIYGGVRYGSQIRDLSEGAEIIVACPGRLIDHMEKGTVDLKNIEVLVLDEADQMFDMGFLPNIRRILSKLPSQRQNLLFSATMPDEVRHLAMEILRNPVRVEVSSGKAATTITQALYNVQQGDKFKLLHTLLGSMETESVLIFTRTKHRAKKLCDDLQHHGYAATSLQGNLSQNQRMRAMDGFRSGKYQIMVATDIAARGIDISTVTHVVNFDMPDTVDAYVHRIGRTGRAARTGDALTFVTPEDISMVRAIEKRIQQKVERRELEGFPLFPERQLFGGNASSNERSPYRGNKRSGNDRRKAQSFNGRRKTFGRRSKSPHSSGRSGRSEFRKAH